MPRVDVILPVKNGIEYIGDAIASILFQTFKDLRLIVVDDGSKDGTFELVKQIAELDRRVHLIINESSGIVSALNTGIKMSDSEFVARMDADDISLPNRIIRQVEYMKSYPLTALLGTGVCYFGAKDEIPTILSDPIRCKAALCLFNPISHPTVLIRRECLTKAGMYNGEFQFAEDFELWVRLAEYGEINNIAEPLLFYRIHEGQLSNQHRFEQKRLVAAITSRAIMNRLGVRNLTRVRTLNYQTKMLLNLGPAQFKLSVRSLWSIIRQDANGAQVH